MDEKEYSSTTMAEESGVYADADPINGQDEDEPEDNSTSFSAPRLEEDYSFRINKSSQDYYERNFNLKEVEKRRLIRKINKIFGKNK